MDITTMVEINALKQWYHLLGSRRNDCLSGYNFETGAKY